MQSVLSYLPGHGTRFLVSHGIGEIDCLNRRSVIQMQSAAQWYSVFAFFLPFLYDMPESFQQSENEKRIARITRPTIADKISMLDELLQG